MAIRSTWEDNRGGVGLESYPNLLELSSDEQFSGEVKVQIDLNDILNPAGEDLKGFEAL